MRRVPGRAARRHAASGWGRPDRAATSLGGYGPPLYPLARELATPAADSVGRTARPAADVDWGYPEELAPAVFESHLLGGVIPFGTVLELAGALAQGGPDALLELELLSPLGEAVLRCGERRFAPVLSHHTPVA